MRIASVVILLALTGCSSAGERAMVTTTQTQANSTIPPSPPPSTAPATTSQVQAWKMVMNDRLASINEAIRGLNEGITSARCDALAVATARAREMAPEAPADALPPLVALFDELDASSRPCVEAAGGSAAAAEEARNHWGIAADYFRTAQALVHVDAPPATCPIGGLSGLNPQLLFC